jgi:hypothetical protein
VTGSDMLLQIAAKCRTQAGSLVEVGARLAFDPQPLIDEELQRAALYEATARDIAHLPENQQADQARRFMHAMWARDDEDDPVYAPDNDHP